MLNMVKMVDYWSEGREFRSQDHQATSAGLLSKALNYSVVLKW